MNKFIVFLLCALFFGSCNEEEDSIYYPLDNVDIIKGGSEEPTGNATLIAESHNLESYVLDTLAVYPYDKTIGKLTFKFDPKNAVSDVTMEGFRGEGKSEMGMSNSYYDGNFPEEYRQPIFMNDNPAKKYRIKFRLKGEFRYYTEHWYTDYIYMMLSASFLPYPPAVSEDVFLCKSNEAFAELNTAERLYTFDVQYDRWNLSFTELYLNIFVNLIGQKESEKVSLSIDKESFFEIYEITNSLSRLKGKYHIGCAVRNQRRICLAYSYMARYRTATLCHSYGFGRMNCTAFNHS